MRKQTLLISFFVLLAAVGYAQNGHTPLKCVGDIPEDFLKLSYQKYEDDKSNISEGESRRDKKDKKNFYLESNYQLDRLLQTGSVLFGDELTVYVNKVASNLLDKNGKTNLKKELRFYVVKSSQINAFATQQGMIFVTVGLLAQIENEAQLAFVLAHEISHYVKKHNITSYIETKKQERAHRRSRKSFEDLVTNLSTFSKEQELEADRDGFVMFEKAGYDVEEATSMMLVLQYSHLPFDEVKFDKTFFNSGYYKIPEANFSDSLNIEIEDNSGDDDSQSSHPNIKNRIKEMDELLEDETTIKGGKKFLLEEKLFTNAQKTARLENLNLNLLSGEYIRVAYEGFLLKNKYPENKYLDVSIAKGLYALSKIRTNSSDNDNENYSETVSDYEGESKVLYNLLLNKMNPKEITILALKYMHGISDKTLVNYKKDLILDLLNKHEMPLEEFSKKYIAPKKNALIKEKKDTVDYDKLSKIEKIRYKKKKLKKKELVNSDYYKLAFVDEMKDKEFVALFEEMKDEEIVPLESEVYADMSYDEVKKYIKKKEKEYDKVNLGIDKIVILDPQFNAVKRVFMSVSDKKNRDLVKSEKKGLELNKVLKSSAESAGIEYSILCKEEYINSSTKLFNDEALVKEWLGEYGYYYDYHMIPLTQNRVDEFTKEYGTNYLLLSSVSSDKYRYFNLANLIFLVAPATYPYIIYSTLKNRYNNSFSNVILDMKTLEIKMLREREINKRMNIFNVKSIVYDLMCDIKKEKK